MELTSNPRVDSKDDHFSEIRYRRLFEASRDGILILNAVTLQTIDVNPALVEFLGYSKDELLGKEPWEIGLFSDKGASQAVFKELLETGYLRYEDLQIETRDGQRRNVEFVGNVYDEDGQQLIQCSIRAIREPKRIDKEVHQLNARLEQRVAELEKAEDERRENEYLLAASQRITSLGSWVIDISEDGVWQKERWSDEHYRIFGVKPDEFEISNENFYKLVHPDDREHLAKTIDEAFAQHKSFEIEHRIVRPDGTLRHVLAMAEVVHDAESGRPKKLVGAVQDITDRKNAEEALVASEERYRSVVETAPDVIVTIDDSSTIRFINPAAERIFGYRMDELKGASLLMLMPEYLRRLHEVGMKRYQETGVKHVPWEYLEVAGLHKSGREIPITISFSEFVQNGRRFFTGIIRDITDRKRAMEALSASEERYRELVENALDIIYTHDLTGRYTSVNGVAETITGFTKDEILAMNIADAIPEEELETAKKIIATKLAGEEAPTHEVELRTKDGRGVLVEVNSRIIYEDGVPVGVQGIARDITERKQQEEARLASERKYHDIFNLAPVGIYRSLSDGTILTANNALAEILGYESADELLSVSFAEFYIDQGEREKLVAESLEIGRVSDFDLHWKRKDGSPIWIQLTCRAISQTPDGQLCYEGFVRDVSQSKQMLETLRENELRLRTIIDTEPECVKLLAKDGSLLEMNLAGLRMIEADSFEQVANRSVFGLIVEEDRKSFRDLTERVFQGESCKLEFELIGHKGTRRWMDTHASPLRDATGKITALLAITRDVSERKLGEAARLASERKYQDLFTLAPVGIYQSKPDGSYTTANAALANMLGYDSVDELLTKKFSDVYFNPDDRRDILDKYEERGYVTDIDLQWRRKDGSPIWVQLTAHAIKRADGATEYFEGFVRDITKQKAVEESLRESNEKFKQLADHISDVFWIRSPDMSKIYYISPAYEQIWGRKLRDDFADPDEWQEHIFPQDRQRVKEAYAGLMLDQAQIEVEFRIRRPDGEQRWIRARGFQVKDASGEVIRLAGIVTDITAHKQSEASLVESQEQLKLATDAASIGIWDWDLVEGTIKWDARMYDLYGNQDEDFSGPRETWNLNHHPDDHERVIEELAAAEKGPGDFHSEFRVVWPNGEVRHLESNAKVLRDKNGKAVRFIGVNWDITERKLAEETLREADQRAILDYGLLLNRISKLALALGDARDLDTVFEELREFALVSTGMDGLVISLFDAKQNTRTAAYIWNEGARVDATPLPPMPMSNSPHSRAVRTGEIIIIDDYQAAMESQPVLHLGGDLPQSSMVVPMSVMGKIVGGVEVQSNHLAAFTESHATALQMAANLAANAIENVRLLDIERAQAEQLRQAHKMEAVGVLAGGIAHDFNNLLTAINGFSDMTLRKMAADDPLRRNIEEINRSGNRAAELTSQLLAFSRKQMLVTSIINLNSVVSNIETMLRRLIPESIELRALLAPDLWNVMADSGQIEQVLMNLAINARDAMPDGGNLTIETKNVRIDQQFAERHMLAAGDFVRMTVSDTGEGMDADTQSHIFEPFYTTKEVGKGTGLGLATAYGIVQQSGGAITVYSEPGHGSTFKVYLPCVDQAVDGPTLQSEDVESSDGTETILLVEDEDAVRGFVSEVLESNGYKVLAAESGPAALKLCKDYTEPIHLLISDVIMPKMGGAELKDNIVELLPDIKVLFISGYTNDSLSGLGVDHQNLAFLEKPFTPDSIIRKVRSVLDKD